MFGMMASTKVFMAALAVRVCATATQAELLWEQTQLELRPAVGDETAVCYVTPRPEPVLCELIYAEKWNHVRQNPVRGGLVARAEEWPYQGEVVYIDRA